MQQAMATVNGFYGQPPPMAVAAAGATAWQEYRSPDGRVYYHNSATKETQWTKPEELMTPAERALSNQPWKEYTAEGGRKYWSNTETKETTWEMPEVYQRALGLSTSLANPAAPPPSAISPTGPPDATAELYPLGDQQQTTPPWPEPRQLAFGDDPLIARAFVPASAEPEYATAEEAEAAFFNLLRRTGVQPGSDWEETLHAIVKDPEWRAIKDPRERKAAFEQYCHDVVAQDKERAKERMTKLRADFATMLKSHPEIKHCTHWKTARALVQGEPVFRDASSEAERRQLFDDYVADLKRDHRDRQAALRKSAMDGLTDLLPQLNLEPYTRWSDAQGIISATPPFQTEDRYKSLGKFDLLTVFQSHMKALERAFNDSRQEKKAAKFRQERRNRDAFKALLAHLRRDGKIKAGSKWGHVYSDIARDERYKAMIGQAGSTPQELFWDAVEEEERALRGTRNDVEDVIDDKRFEITPKTTFDSFLALMRDDHRTANIDRDVLTLIFERLQEKKKEKRSDDDRHRSDSSAEPWRTCAPL